MPLASEYTQKPDSSGLWDKLKTSTKQLSSSRSEKDGDSITSTVVHEALVRYYKKQEPFQGFPGWLGHKEDLPDEQKILRKQNEQLAKQAKPSKLHNFKEATSDYVSAHSPPIGNRHSSSGESTQRHTSSDSTLPRRRTAGMGFRAIYQSQSSNNTSLLPPETPNTTQQSRPSSSSSGENPYANMSAGSQRHRQTPSWASSNSQNSSSSNPSMNRPSMSQQTSSDLMSERLKRRTGRNPF